MHCLENIRLGVTFEYTGERALDDPVALARETFEPSTIQDDHSPATVRDEAGHLKLTCGLAHGRTTHAKHLRQEILRQLEPVARHPIVHHQEPARAALLHRV